MSYLVEFDVEEDLRHAGCAVCRGANRAGHTYVHGLLREDATNPDAYEELRRARGLCREHIRLAVAIAAEEQDARGGAILLEFLLSCARRRLSDQVERTVVRRLRGRRRAGVGLPGSSECPACLAERRWAESYLDIMLRSDRSSEIGRRLALNDRGLCLVHAAMALESAGDTAARRTVVQLFERRARRLQEVLAEGLRSADLDTLAQGGSPLARAVWIEGPAWLAGSRAGSKKGR